MRGVGHEAALGFALGVDEREQAVERGHQGPHFGGCAVGIDGAEVARRAAFHGLLEIDQGAQRARHGPGHRHAGQQQQQQVGQQHPREHRFEPVLARVRPVGQHDDEFTGGGGIALRHHAVGDAAFDHAHELRAIGRRQHGGQPAVAQQGPAAGVLQAVGGKALTLLEEFLHRWRQQQGQPRPTVQPRHAGCRHGRVGGPALLAGARDHHRVGQQGHQAQQLLVLLQGGGTRALVVEEHADQAHQAERQHQQHQQAALQAPDHALGGAAFRPVAHGRAA